MTLDVDVVAGEALKPVGALRSTIESMLQLPAEVVLQRVFLVLLTPMQLRCGAGRHSRIRGQPMRLLPESEDALTLFDLGIEQEETSVRLRVEMGKRQVQPVPDQASEAPNLPSSTSTTITHAPAAPLMPAVARSSSEGPPGVRNGLPSTEVSPQPSSARSASGDCAMASPASSVSGGGSAGSPATPARPQPSVPAAPASSRVHSQQSSCMSISQEDASEHARRASSSTGAGALPQPPLAAAENARALADARLVGDVTGIDGCAPLSDAGGEGVRSTSSAPPLASPALSTTAKPTLPDSPAPSAARFGVSPAGGVQTPLSTSSAAAGAPAASLLGSPPLSGRPAALASPPPSAVRRRNSLEVMMRAAHSLTSRDSVALLRSSAGSPRSAASSSDDEDHEVEHGGRHDHSRSGSASRSAAAAAAAAAPGAGPLTEGSAARGVQGFGTPSMHHQSSSSDPSPLEGAAGRGSSGSMVSTGSVGRADAGAGTAATAAAAAASSACRTTSGPRRRALNTAASARSAMLSPSEHYSPAAPVTGGGPLFFGRGGSPSGFVEGAAAAAAGASGAAAAGEVGSTSARSAATDNPAGDAAGSAAAPAADGAAAAAGAGAGPARPSFAAVVQAITFARTLAKHAKENIARERRRVSGLAAAGWGTKRRFRCWVFRLCMHRGCVVRRSHRWGRLGRAAAPSKCLSPWLRRRFACTHASPSPLLVISFTSVRPQSENAERMLSNVAAITAAQKFAQVLKVRTTR